MNPSRHRQPPSRLEGVVIYIAVVVTLAFLASLLQHGGLFW